MNNLPVELLFKIFKKTNFKDQKNIRLVNKQYRSIINSKVFQKNIYHILFKRLSRNIVYNSENQGFKALEYNLYFDNLLDKDVKKSKPFWKNLFITRKENTFIIEKNIGLTKKFIIIGKNINKVELYFENTLLWKCNYIAKSNNIIKVEPFEFGMSSSFSRKIKLVIKAEMVDKVFSYNFITSHNMLWCYYNSPKEFNIVFFNKNKLYTKIIFYDRKICLEE